MPEISAPSAGESGRTAKVAGLLCKVVAVVSIKFFPGASFVPVVSGCARLKAEVYCQIEAAPILHCRSRGSRMSYRLPSALVVAAACLTANAAAAQDAVEA